MTAIRKIMAAPRTWQIVLGVVLLVLVAPVLLWLVAVVAWVLMLIVGAVYYAVMLLWAAVLAFAAR